MKEVTVVFETGTTAQSDLEKKGSAYFYRSLTLQSSGPHEGLCFSHFQNFVLSEILPFWPNIAKAFRFCCLEGIECQLVRENFEGRCRASYDLRRGGPTNILAVFSEV